MKQMIVPSGLTSSIPQFQQKSKSYWFFYSKEALARLNEQEIVQVEWIVIPAGEFQMGEGEDAHPVYLPAFSIAKYPLTNCLYQPFLEATGHPPGHGWHESHSMELLGNHPVVNVSWHEAMAYCRWLSQETDQRYRLPTEAEWEKTARGTDGRPYPWGHDFDKEYCNTGEGSIGRTTPVDAYPAGASPYGVMDLVGNVWEWCSSLYADYPYRMDDGREDPTAEGWRVLRGGSWFDMEWGARPARRLSGPPDSRSRNTGFRLVREIGA